MNKTCQQNIIEDLISWLQLALGSIHKILDTKGLLKVRFGQAKFPDGGSVLGKSQFSTLPKLPPKILFDLKVVKIDPN